MGDLCSVSNIHVCVLRAGPPLVFAGSVARLQMEAHVPYVQILKEIKLN